MKNLNKKDIKNQMKNQVGKSRWKNTEAKK